MTPGTQIFLHQEQVEELWRRSASDRRHRALGMHMDDGEVVHVYLSPPSAHYAGRPCAAIVELRETTEGAPAAPDLGPQDAAEVVVLLDQHDNRISGRGFVLRDGVWAAAEVQIIPVQPSLYRRSAGLLETAALASRSVAVVGLGSGGSTIAVALAQAGVGGLTLVDRDRLEVGNVSRHACGLGDVGRRKTNAVRDLVMGRNPAADVTIHDIDILANQTGLRQALEGTDLVIAATDSDPSRFVLNQAALDTGLTTIFGRVLARACGGDVLRVRPGQGPCVACIYTRQFLEQRPREIASIKEAREDSPGYTSAADLEAKVQVGLASDIAPVANLMTKLALVELSRGTGGGLESLDGDLLADFYLWANRREGAYQQWPAMGFSFVKPAILRWYGADMKRRPDCGACGSTGAGDADFFGTGEPVRIPEEAHR